MNQKQSDAVKAFLIAQGRVDDVQDRLGETLVELVEKAAKPCRGRISPVRKEIRGLAVRAQFLMLKQKG